MSSEKPRASTQGRSVVDYVSAEELQNALKTVTPHGFAKNDWLLPVPDPEAEEQTVEGEMARLLTLKSYMLLDAENEEAFDKLTQEACEVFGVPTSLISLIDLGRQYLFSNTGADVRETPRSIAFCSHTILNKKGLIVVNDTVEDDRFKENPLVTEGPHLRFYAAAPLVSPEGHKLGTFCVEGPEPRPEGLSEEEKLKLKDYAAKTMEMMVERRRVLRDRLAGNSVSDEMLRHAAVTTDLGVTLFSLGDSVIAMRLFQESIQTIMHGEGDGNGTKPSAERQETMADSLRKLSDETTSKDHVQELLNKLASLFDKSDDAAEAAKLASAGFHPVDGIPGLFIVTNKLKGMSAPRTLPGLVFAESFKIDLLGSDKSKSAQLEELPFTVSLGECSKATLFNMGLIHYYWGRPDTALQFFHLAASVSQKFSPLKFDPVDLACVNNMAQIHLQVRRPADAMKMIEQALERGNKTLAELYNDVGVDDEVDDSEDEAPCTDLVAEEEASRKTRRLRRKLARTIINMGHVHFFNCNYEDALARCCEAMPLLDDRMEGREKAAIYYNLALIYYHQQNYSNAISYMDKFLDDAPKYIGNDHVQIGDAMFHKGQILFDMGSYEDAMDPLMESLRIRRLILALSPGIVAESLGLLGKVYLALNKVDAALESLVECLELQRKILIEDELTFEAAQTLLDLGRAYHAKDEIEKSLESYLEVIEWARKFFGVNHAFVARIAGIISNLYIQTGNDREAASFAEEASQGETQ